MCKIKKLAAALLVIAIMLPVTVAIAQSDDTTLTHEAVETADYELGNELDYQQYLLLTQMYQIFYDFAWDDLPPEALVDIRLGMDDLEQRMAFETNYALGFDILLDPNVFSRLNLFFRNYSDEYAFFHILAFGVEAQPFVFLVPPGGEHTIQLMPMDIIAVIVEVTIVSIDGEPVDGEFALRLTDYPLPN